MIKKTTKLNNNSVVSAYKDNVAFIKGPKVEQFSPKYSEKPSIYQNSSFESVISIKAETHNFPTTVEPLVGLQLVLEEKLEMISRWTRINSFSGDCRIHDSISKI